MWAGVRVDKWLFTLLKFSRVFASERSNLRLLICFSLIIDDIVHALISGWRNQLSVVIHFPSLPNTNNDKSSDPSHKIVIDFQIHT